MFAEKISHLFSTIQKTNSQVYLAGILIDSTVEALVARSQLCALLIVGAENQLHRDSGFCSCKVSEQPAGRSFRID